MTRFDTTWSHAKAGFSRHSVPVSDGNQAVRVGTASAASTAEPLSARSVQPDHQLRLFEESKPASGSWWGVAVAAAAVIFITVFTLHQWTSYERFALFGFDTGIFAQGTWLLAHLEEPFVTLRGLNLFGDHASFILVLVAPVYRIWPDPRMLILLQSIALAVPALVLYRLGVRWVSKAAGSAVSLAYLLCPAAQWAAAWQFHPEVLAAAFLSLAVLAADSRHDKRMWLCLVLAAMCKEDVSLVIFGFGCLLWSVGRRRIGVVVAAGSLLYFVVVTQVVMRLINGSGNLYFRRNYGVEGTGPLAIAQALPDIATRMVSQAFSAEGVLYLALLFGPLAFLPFLGARWLLPVAAPLCLNLASNVTYQHQISFHYLATSAPFVAIAALVGLQRLRQLGAPIVASLIAMLLVATGLSYSHGPRGAVEAQARQTPKADNRAAVAAMIPSGATVSAQYNLDTHLTDRVGIYEFPNPFHAANWGIDDTPASPAVIEAVEYVFVERSTIGPEDRDRVRRLQTDPVWQTRFDDGNVVLLQRVGTK